MRIALIALVFTAAAVAQEAAPNEATRPGPPTIERSAGGIVVIKGSSRPAPPAEEPPAEAPAGDAEAKTGAEAEKKASEKPAESRRREVSGASYGVNGDRNAELTRQTVVREKDTVQTVVTRNSINGRTVPFLKSTEKVVKKTEAAQSVERRTQRYDVAGRPTQQEVVIEEKKTLPGGGTETIATRYVEDVNGHMQPSGRTVTRETKEGSATKTVMTEQSVDAHGRFQQVLREESVDKETPSGHQIETVRYANDGAGTLREVGREKSTLTESAGASKTTSEKWELNPINDRLELMEKVEGQSRKSASGVEQETIRTYGYESSSGARNVNATRMELQELVQREIKPSANGGQVVNTTTQGRDPGDNSQMGRKIVTQEVTKPGADGATIETQVFEQGVNGRLRATSVTVEKIEK